MKVDLDALEATAKAATSGEWVVVDHAGTAVVAECPCDCPESDGCLWGFHPAVVVAIGSATTANAQHIAAADPATVLALIARIRELDEALNDALAYTIPGDDRDRLVRVLAKDVTR